MRRYQTYRYKCDYCKKRGGSKKFMAKHEAGCTNNPDRVCGMCAAAGFDQRPVSELSDILVASGFKEMQKACSECPACTLAATRQTEFSRFNSAEWNGTGVPIWSDYGWDFKAACTAFWEVHSERGGYYGEG